ncbi:hypothetical protein ACIGNX_26050 [Actinosynnema sp. NPDC053489]
MRVAHTVHSGAAAVVSTTPVLAERTAPAYRVDPPPAPDLRFDPYG